MKETELRIQKYKALLPRARERVIAALLLFSFSIAILTVSTVAWFTLSQSPEISGMTATIAANGNLEIALSDKDGLIPDAVAIGDGAVGKTLAQKNLTWGNIVNLADASYGLDYLSLRPAVLNDSSENTNLQVSPFYTLTYGHNGRVNGQMTNFAYTSWVWNDESDTSLGGKFLVLDESNYGVRAVSSVKYENDNTPFRTLKSNADGKLRIAVTNYEVLTEYPGTAHYNGKTNPYIESLADLIAIYLNIEIQNMLGQYTGGNTNNDLIFNDDSSARDSLGDMVEMVRLLYEYYLQAGDALVETIAIYQYLYRETHQGWTYTKYTFEELLSLVKTTTGKKELTDINVAPAIITLIENYSLSVEGTKQCLEELSKYYELSFSETDVSWNTDVEKIVNKLVNIDTCKINGKSLNAFISEIKAAVKDNLFNAAGAINGVIGKDPKVEITGGYVKNFENFTGARMNVENLEVKTSLITMAPDIYTNATQNLFSVAIETAYADATAAGEESLGKATAAETYGLAVDFWLRCNASQTYLTLEGDFIRDEVNDTVSLSDGTKAEILILTLEAQNGDETYYQENEVYKQNGKYYNLDETEFNYDTTIWKVSKEENKKKTIIVGYTGENRIWDEYENNYGYEFSDYSTSQGMGSCYTFYADPVESKEILNMISALKVAFIDAEGRLLAKASFDTRDYYEELGKYTLRLTLDTNNSLLVTNSEGVSYQAITKLTKNEAVRITALVYLDGNLIDNDNVLSSAEIEGELNIQFGSTAELKPAKDDKVAEEEYNVTAALGGTTTFTYELDSNGKPVVHKVPVTVNIDGSDPTTVEASFIRKINNTQGSRQESIVFTKQGNSWVANAEFTKPGTYVLRNVIIDGVTYDLNLTDKDSLMVTVNGFAISSVNFTGNRKTVMTADSFHSEELVVTIESTQNLYPSKVTGVFTDKYNHIVKVPLLGNSGTYTGEAKFIYSGEYTLEFIEVDGEVDPVSEDQIQKITVYTNLTTEIYLFSGSDRFKLETGDDPVQLTMSVIVRDGSGTQMEKLTNVRLYYSKNGSALDTNGVNTNLTWNENISAYTGKFSISEVGSYEFNRLEIGSDVIKNATKYVTIVAYNTDTIEIEENVTEELQYGTQSLLAKFNLIFKNANGTGSAATVIYAKLAKLDSNGGIEEYVVAKYENGAFAIPYSANVSGDWQIVEIKATNVYYDGIEYSGGAELSSVEEFDRATRYVNIPLVVDGTEIEIKTTVFDKIDISYSDAQMSNIVTTVTKVLGAADSNSNGTIETSEITGEFMQTYDLGNFSVKFTDGNGKSINHIISNVTAKIEYRDTNMKKYGGYSVATGDIAWLEQEEVSLVYDSATDSFIGESSTDLRLAGDYTVNLKYTVTGGTATTYTAAKYVVYSKTPSVAIVEAAYAGESDKTVLKNLNASSTTVYFYKYTTSNPCGGDITHYDQPYVKIELMEFGNATGATLAFSNTTGGEAVLYEDGGEGITSEGLTSDYKWSGEAYCTRYIGQFTNKSDGDTNDPAGEITANQLVLTCSSVGNASFIVDIAQITINNPS